MAALAESLYTRNIEPDTNDFFENLLRQLQPNRSIVSRATNMVSNTFSFETKDGDEMSNPIRYLSIATQHKSGHSSKTGHFHSANTTITHQDLGMDKYVRDDILKMLENRIYRIGKAKSKRSIHMGYVVPNPATNMNGGLDWTFGALKQALCMNEGGVNQNYDLAIEISLTRDGEHSEETGYRIITPDLDDRLIDDFVLEDKTKVYKWSARKSDVFFKDEYGNDPNAPTRKFDKLNILDFQLISKNDPYHPLSKSIKLQYKTPVRLRKKRQGHKKKSRKRDEIKIPLVRKREKKSKTRGKPRMQSKKRNNKL